MSPIRPNASIYSPDADGIVGSIEHEGEAYTTAERHTSYRTLDVAKRGPPPEGECQQ